MKHHVHSEQGQALILIVFAAIILIGITGLAVDGSNALNDHRQAQNAADAAALAAARAMLRGSNLAAAGETLADEYGYNNDGDTNLVEVRLCNDPEATCGELEGDPAEYIQVVITSHVKTYFGSIVGWDELTNQTQAITRVEPGGTSSPFGDSSLLVLDPNNTNGACNFNSNAKLNITDGAMFCNSRHSTDAMVVNSNAEINSDVWVVGGVRINSNGHINGTLTTGASPLTYPPDLSAIPGPPSPPTCSGDGHQQGSTYYPGNWSNLNINSNQTANFEPGIYCIGNININSNVTVTGSGDIVFVLGSSYLNMNSNVTADFDSLELYTTSGSLQLNSNASLTTQRFRFYSTGSGGISVNSNAILVSDDAYIYSPSGNFNWNSNGKIQLAAPTSGDYKGLIIYLPISNQNYFNINSNAQFKLTGTFLAPAAPLTFNSNGTMQASDGQIVVYRFTMNSNAKLYLNYDASKFYGDSSNPTIQLVQ